MKWFLRCLGQSVLELAAYVPATVVGLALLVVCGSAVPDVVIVLVMLLPTLGLLACDGLRFVQSLILSALRMAGETLVLWLALGRGAVPLPATVLRALLAQGFGGGAMDAALAPVMGPVVAAMAVACLVVLLVGHMRGGRRPGSLSTKAFGGAADVVNHGKDETPRRDSSCLLRREIPGADGLLR